jgi:hypothetical protein
LSAAATAPPLRPRYLITVDTEGDNLWAQPRTITTRNSHFLPRFQALCERHGLRPTYLTNYEMALCPVFREFGREVKARDAAEIGMHLHAWNNPPLVPRTDDDFRYQPYLMEYPEPVLREKVGVMTDLLEETFGGPVVSHRAGRWGMDEVYARALVDRGYLVDCSVFPRFSWKPSLGAPDGDGGPDYRDFPDRPYYLHPDDIRRPGASPLLEVPMTVVGPRSALGRRLHGLVRGKHRLVRAPINRLFPPAHWLVPFGRSLADLLRTQRQALASGAIHLEFTLHSSELMPGGSPSTPDEASIERLYEKLDALFESAARSCVGATLQEFHRDYSRLHPSPA